MLICSTTIKTGTYEFLEQLINHNFTPQITLPSRITEKTATLVDNIAKHKSIILEISQWLYLTTFRNSL